MPNLTATPDCALRCPWCGFTVTEGPAPPVCTCGMERPWVADRLPRSAPVEFAAADCPPDSGYRRTPWPRLNTLLGGGLPRSAVVLLHGPAGAGKTRVACVAVRRWATLAASLESSPSRFARSALDAGHHGRRLWICEAVPDALPRYPVVVVDSISATELPLATLSAAIKWAASGKTVVLIAHETKAGVCAGFARIQYLVDVRVRVVRDDSSRGRHTVIASVEKNRFGPTGCVRLFLGKPERRRGFRSS